MVVRRAVEKAVLTAASKAYRWVERKVVRRGVTKAASSVEMRAAAKVDRRDD